MVGGYTRVDAQDGDVVPFPSLTSGPRWYSVTNEAGLPRLGGSLENKETGSLPFLVVVMMNLDGTPGADLQTIFPSLHIWFPPSTDGIKSESHLGRQSLVVSVGTYSVFRKEHAHPANNLCSLGEVACGKQTSGSDHRSTLSYLVPCPPPGHVDINRSTCRQANDSCGTEQHSQSAVELDC